MIKLKHILLEKPEDYIDKDIDALDILYKKKKYDVNEAGDHEGKMAKAQLERSMKYAKMIYKIVDNVGNGGEVSMPAWVQSKITKSMDYLQSVYNYLDGKDGLEDKFQKEDITSMPAKFSNPEAKSNIDVDVKKMSNVLGKASQQVIKIMMDGVKSGKYDALDIVRGIETGKVNRTHEGERPFLRMLFRKVRSGFRRYMPKGKLRK